MRIGQNPAKFIQESPDPAPVTVVIVTYIPVMSGYFAQSLDILKLCLNSLWAHTHTDYDLMIFDNASCAEVRQYLLDTQDEGRIQYLMLSDENIGKAGAWNIVFGAAPGEIVAYADMDVYYHPGWLSAQMKVLDTLPNVGMVTGMPMWSPPEFSTGTVKWASKIPDVVIERGKFLSWEDYYRHSRSLGVDEPKAKAHFDSVDDLRMTYAGQQFYVGASHFQFVAPAAVLRRVLPIPNRRPMGQVRLLDVAINERGYLRLSTPEWWVQHVGNRLSETEFHAGVPSGKPKSSQPRRPWLLRWRLTERILYWVYHRLFEFLHR